MEEYSGDVLIQLPALFFNKVGLEVFPDVSMVPDGDAGVLNLSSSSYHEILSPLTLSVGAGWHERYNAGAVFNLNPGKFHITANIIIGKSSGPEHSARQRQQLRILLP